MPDHRESPVPRELNPLQESLESLLKREVLIFSDDRYAGFYYPKDGVQWQIALDRRTREVRLAVNLEGLKYGHVRPIQRVIQAELKSPEILRTVQTTTDPHTTRIHWSRDAWISQRKRIYVQEVDISPTPCMAARLTAQDWHDVLREAARCLTPDGDRALRPLTPVDTGIARHLEVCPHLNIGRPLWKSAPPGAAERLRLVEREAQALEATRSCLVRACR